MTNKIQRAKKPTILQAINSSLKELDITKAAKSCPDETLQVHIFEAVCRYMEDHRLSPFYLEDADYEAAGENHMEYTLGAQVADCYLTKIAKHLEIEPGDFGAEDFYKVSEKMWDSAFWEEEEE